MNMTQINFITVAELARDVRAFSAKLPQDIVAVAGIPRSGVMAASLFALHRNIPLVSLDELQHGAFLCTSTRTTGNPRIPRVKDGKRVLVLDDTINTGMTFESLLPQLQQSPLELILAAVYRAHPSHPQIQAHRRIPLPRVFEWNIFHSIYAQAAILDIDGVLCVDPEESEGDAGEPMEKWLHHVEHAAPLHIPTVPVLGIATGRLEKYRMQTEQWLAKHGVKYGELIMSPHPNASSRRRANDTGRMKAALYSARPNAGLFIESSAKHSAEIATRTGRPVLCTDTMQMF